MKYFKIILSAIIVFSFDCISIGQSNSTELLDVEGAISISNSSTDMPKEGTIRWTGQDFEGWNGVEWKSLTAGKNTISDIDNNEYDIVTIGNQTWMADNLRVTRFNDGTPIPLVDNAPSWANSNSPAYTWYDNTRNDFQSF